MFTVQGQIPQKHQESQVPVDTDKSNVSAPGLQALANVNTDATGGLQATDSLDSHTDTTPVALAALHHNSKQYQESKDTDNSDASAPSLQAPATVNTDAIGGTQATDSLDSHTHTKPVAQPVLQPKSKQYRVSQMDIIKSELQHYLDHLKERQTKRSSHLEGLLSEWVDIWLRDRSQALLVYVLGSDSGQYKGRKLETRSLNILDRTKTKVLMQHCSKQGVCVHLAKMSSSVITSPDKEIDVKTTMQLRQIRCVDRALLIEGPVNIKRENIIQKNYLEDRYHRTVESSKAHPTPGEGITAPENDTSRNFEDWVLLLIPEGHRFKFLVENAEPLQIDEWLGSEYVSLSNMDSIKMDTTRRWGVLLACKTRLDNIRHWTTHEWNRTDSEAWCRQAQSLLVIVRICLKIRDTEAFGAAITMDPMMLSVAGWKEIGSTMELAKFVTSYRKWFNQALSRINFLQDRYIILSNIREGCETQREHQVSLIDVKNWFQTQIEQAFRDIGRVEENDAAILVTIVQKFPKDIAVNKILAFATKHSSNCKFTIELALSLYDAIGRKSIDIGRAKYLLAGLLPAAMPYLCLRCRDNWSLQPRCPSPASTSNKYTLHADRMVRLLCCCLVAGFDTEERLLLQHYYLDALMADAATLQNLFLPYLKRLLKMMHAYRIPLTKDCYRRQFQQVLTYFIIRYIGAEPPELPADFTRLRLGCKQPSGCITCLALDAFLVHPYRQTTVVFGGIDAPEHLTTQLQGADHLEMAVTSLSVTTMTSTIRVMKTKAMSDHDRWRERVIKANDMIQDICRDEKWKMLLGDKYDECMGLKRVMR